MIRIAIGEIINYGPWVLSPQQRDTTKFAITKVMLRPAKADAEKQGMVLAAMDPRELDVILGPFEVSCTYRP